MKILLLSFLVIGLSACSKKSDLLYRDDHKSVKLTSSHKVKELVGENKLDILFVIDNSGSMAPYQDSVATNTQVFIDALSSNSQLDWKIGLISTDPTNLPYEGFDSSDPLTSKTADRVDRFMTAVHKLGTGGSGVERTYEPVIGKLTEYSDFIRPNAAFALILVSDAPEQSQMSTKEFFNKMSQLRPEGQNFSFFGILCPEEWCTPTDDHWTLPGSKFEELTKLAKSKLYPICDPQFGKNLVDIGKDLAKQATFSTIYLKERPKLKTLKLFYNNHAVPGGSAEDGGFWIYDYGKNAVIIHNMSFAPGENEEVNVTYEVDDGYPISPP